jgi:hypothetical protein
VHWEELVVMGLGRGERTRVTPKEGLAIIVSWKEERISVTCFVPNFATGEPGGVDAHLSI